MTSPKINTHDAKTKATGDEYREEAARNRREAQESFARCDTDGFASQYASGISARLADAKARLADQGWEDEFPCLVDEDDRRIDAKLIDGKYGPVWLLSDAEEATFGRRFVPAERRRGKRTSRVQKALGIRESTEMAPANACLDCPPGAKGFSGMTSVYVRVFRTDGK